MDMAKIAGAVANGGCSAEPKIVNSVKTPQGEMIVEQESAEMVQRFSEETANELDQRWSSMVEDYYRTGDGALDTLISYAKTGTAQKDIGLANKLLLGVSKSCNVAFMVVVEDYSAGDPLPAQIANTMIAVISNAADDAEEGA
jgi:membrane peptidoglycan carboxypeptidase